MLHLIHPAMVHFTVALVVLGGIAEAAGILAEREPLARQGGRLLVFGLLSLLPTIVSGYLAGNTLELAGERLALLGSHEQNGLILLGLLLASQFWKAWSGGRLEGLQARLYVLLLAVVVASTAYSAWLGGQMVYVLGIGVR